MSIPTAILEAKRTSNNSETPKGSSGRPSIPLPIFFQHPKVAEPTPIEIELAGKLLWSLEWPKQHWFGLASLVVCLSLLGMTPAAAILAFVATVARSWLALCVRGAAIHYKTKVRPFIVAHLLWGCTREERDYRRSLCGACEKRYEGGDGRNYCKAMQTTCKCGHWLFSSLEWLTGLANWGCPNRYFVREVNESSWLIAEKQKKERSNGSQ